MIDNLPSNQREGGQQTSDSHDFIYEDKRALRLSHYVMAERCMLVEYKTIQDEIREGQSDTLIYILEGGHRGFHKYSEGALIEEYKDMDKLIADFRAKGTVVLFEFPTERDKKGYKWTMDTDYTQELFEEMIEKVYY